MANGLTLKLRHRKTMRPLQTGVLERAGVLSLTVALVPVQATDMPMRAWHPRHPPARLAKSPEIKAARRAKGLQGNTLQRFPGIGVDTQIPRLISSNSVRYAKITARRDRCDDHARHRIKKRHGHEKEKIGIAETLHEDKRKQASQKQHERKEMIGKCRRICPRGT